MVNRSKYTQWLAGFVESAARGSVADPNERFEKVDRVALIWDKRWMIAYRVWFKRLRPNGNASDERIDRDTELPKTSAGRIALFRLMFRAALRGKAVSSIAMPYVLFALAVISGLVAAMV